MYHPAVHLDTLFGQVFQIYLLAPAPYAPIVTTPTLYHKQMVERLAVRGIVRLEIVPRTSHVAAYLRPQQKFGHNGAAALDLLVAVAHRNRHGHRKSRTARIAPLDRERNLCIRVIMLLVGLGRNPGHGAAACKEQSVGQDIATVVTQYDTRHPGGKFIACHRKREHPVILDIENRKVTQAAAAHHDSPQRQRSRRRTLSDRETHAVGRREVIHTHDDTRGLGLGQRETPRTAVNGDLRLISRSGRIVKDAASVVQCRELGARRAVRPDDTSPGNIKRLSCPVRSLERDS